MTVTKLSIADKKEIQRLYCETDATTNQLAKQYGISASTVLRLLQELIPPEEYKQIVSQKQAKSKGTTRSSTGSRLNLEVSQLNLITSDRDDFSAPATGSTGNLDNENNWGHAVVGSDDLELRESIQSIEDIEESVDPANLNADDLNPDELAGDLEVDELVDDEFGDDSDLLDEDEDEDEEDEENETLSLEDISNLVIDRDKVDPASILNILPLEEASLPEMCYIVIDKAAEIVTRPLQDFKDLGKIPPGETNARTIPLFDNHRIARRFSNPNQRVIKFPGDLIYATHAKLAQKGITRLLFEGRVYAL